MGSGSSKLVEDKQKFTLKVDAKLVSEETVDAEDRKKALAFLSSPAFKKRANTDLNNNFETIKISIDSLKVQNNLKVVIMGTIKVLKKISESEDLVKDGLETVLPHSAAAAGIMPGKSPKFDIRFSNASVAFTDGR
jgi:plasmid replication initiation protein